MDFSEVGSKGHVSIIKMKPKFDEAKKRWIYLSFIGIILPCNTNTENCPKEPSPVKDAMVGESWFLVNW